jgi:hypothetical protein
LNPDNGSASADSIGSLNSQTPVQQATKILIFHPNANLSQDVSPFDIDIEEQYDDWAPTNERLAVEWKAFGLVGLLDMHFGRFVLLCYSCACSCACFDALRDCPVVVRFDVISPVDISFSFERGDWSLPSVHSSLCISSYWQVSELDIPY